MIRRTLATLLALAFCCHAAESDSMKRAAELFKQAHKLADRNRRKVNPDAMAKIEQAVKALDAGVADGEEVPGNLYRDLQWAAEKAREDMLAHEKSLAYARRMIKYDETGRRKRDARLQMAATYRAMKKYDKARELYDAIVADNPDDKEYIALPRAEMVYLEIGDKKRGRKLLDAALMNKEVWGIARYRFAMGLAERALFQGRREAALAWYGLIEKMPDEKPRDHKRHVTRAWYEMGKIQESFGRTDAAKALYRKARDLEGGDMGYRVRARDAIESIEYFE